MKLSTADTLWHDPRLAVIHSPTFNDRDLVLSLLEQPHWINSDPELVLVRHGLLQPHFLDRFIRDCLWFTASFSVLTPSDPTAWQRTLNEVADYATHLLVFWDGTAGTIRDFLYCPDRPKRPIKVVMTHRQNHMS